MPKDFDELVESAIKDNASSNEISPLMSIPTVDVSRKETGEIRVNTATPGYIEKPMVVNINVAVDARQITVHDNRVIKNTHVESQSSTAVGDSVVGALSRMVSGLLRG